MKLIPELEEIRKKGASNLQHVELVFNKYMEQKTIYGFTGAFKQKLKYTEKISTVSVQERHA